MKTIQKILIANRGAVARSVIRAARKLGIQTVAIYSDADQDLKYLADATETYHVGESSALKSYLNQDKILEIARISQADAIHPGYGFLAENAEFAQRVEEAGLVFIGPRAELIRLLGHKTQARDLMREYGLPMVKSSPVLSGDPEEMRRYAQELGYPILLKPAAGGGGIGMLPVDSEENLLAQFERASALTARSFGVGDIYMEQLLEQPRHIEFQFLADRHGQVQCLFERDCSAQRRHQKIIEEAPAPALPREEVLAMGQQLTDVLTKLKFDVIGTIEMLYTPRTGFVFLEVNTRLQVEHAVTEETTGVDLIASQIRLAAGESLSDVLPEPVQQFGYAIEARVYAEDPKRMLPSPGVLKVFQVPEMEGLRIETGYHEGARVSSYYDPMVAKVIASGQTREQANARLQQGLEAFQIEGIKTNIPLILQILQSARFQNGEVSTDLVTHVLSQPKDA